MRLFSILVALALMLGLAPVRAADVPPGCDSCAIKVDSLVIVLPASFAVAA